MLATAVQLLQEAQPFFGHLDINKVQVSLATPAELNTLEKIIQLAYNWRYCDADGQQTSFQEVKSAPNTQTLVAKIILNQQELILGTARLVSGQNLEIFSFFALPENQLWTPQAKNLTPYEVERLAFHPLLDLETDLHFKILLLQKMFHFLLTLIPDPVHSWLGVTMRGNVQQFVAAAGIPHRKITAAHFVHNAVSQKFMQIHPRYFTDIAAYEIKINQ